MKVKTHSINTDSVCIRPVKDSDLEAVLKLAKKASIGLTNLPADEKLLSTKIQNSVNSFAINPTRPGIESYFFVMEVTEADGPKIIGTSEIVAKVGGFEPFYSYQIKKAVHESKDLDVHQEIDTLHLVAEHDCPTELCTLFLDPDYRGTGLGKLLSLSRFLFIASFPERFEDTIMAEMRGVSDEKGYSPFWEKLVKHFFEMDFKKADFLSVQDKNFIADLMPKHPIYIPILPEDVQDVIGKVHKNTAPGLKLLESEGFQFTQHVDIFDAGPRIAAKAKDIKSIKNSKTEKLNLNEQIEAIACNSEGLSLISNSKIDFRACLAPSSGDSIEVSSKQAELLNSSSGEEVRYLNL